MTMTLQVRPRQTMTWAQFLSETPERSIALDGAVSGGPAWDEKTLHVNFDHHDGVVREATMSTAMQVLFAIKGGQHVNKVESAIRITHIASGIIVKCQAERSQHKNRANAMKMLIGMLYEQRREQREAEFEKTYVSDKMENGFGSQIRTWTLTPYQMVKDERTGFKANNVSEVLDGELDQLIESYLLWAANPKQ